MPSFRFFPYRALPGIALAAVLLLAACADTPAPDAPAVADVAEALPALEPLTLTTRADSVAARAFDALGGREAWRALRYLSFEFAGERDGERSPTGRRHLWDRHTGDYRIEWTAEDDTAVVVLFNVNTREGAAYANGTALEGEAADAALERAYGGYINDTYWLLMPVKLFDPGVSRAYDAEQSDAESDVIQLTFGDVGLTPGDTYWVWVDKASGFVTKWAYVLQRNPDADPSAFEWTDYAAYPGPAGPVQMSSRKNALGQPRALLTDRIETPASVPAERFTQP